MALNFLSIPVALFYLLFYPITKFALGLSKMVLKYIFKVKIEQKNESRVFGRIDLNNLFGRMDGVNLAPSHNIDSEIKLFQNALDFSKLKIRECMIPRTEMVMLELNEEMGILRQKFVETGFSKIMIFEGSSDNIIGYVHSSISFYTRLTFRDVCIKYLSSRDPWKPTNS